MGRHFAHRQRLAWALLPVLAAACASSRAHPPPGSTVPSEPASASPSAARARAHEDAQATLPAWSGGRAIVSNAGAYRVIYRSSPDPIPRGEEFALEVWVFGAHAADHPLTDVALTVDAGMPEHQHGMNRRPVIRSLDGGKFEVQGLLFHMPGRWELYFDVTRGAVTERAQVSLELL